MCSRKDNAPMLPHILKNNNNNNTYFNNCVQTTRTTSLLSQHRRRKQSSVSEFARCGRANIYFYFTFFISRFRFANFHENDIVAVTLKCS